MRGTKTVALTELQVEGARALGSAALFLLFRGAVDTASTVGDDVLALVSGAFPRPRGILP